jgi:hypothetical protein
MDGHRLINQVTLDNIESADDDLRLISAHGSLAQALQSIPLFLHSRNLTQGSTPLLALTTKLAVSIECCLEDEVP